MGDDDTEDDVRPMMTRTQVLRTFQWSDRTLYRKIANHGFPRSAVQGRWYVDEVAAWQKKND